MVNKEIHMEAESYDYFVANAVSIREPPTTYEEAMQSAERSKWVEAIEKEKRSLDKHNVFEMRPLPPGFSAVGSKWVFAYKYDAHGEVSSYKARLVAQGFTQRAGIDYDETYAPVARMASTRIFLAYTTRRRFHLMQADVKTAYLNGDMEQEVYMRIPRGYDNPKGQYFKVKKSLYGLCQSAHQWNKRIDQDLKDMDFYPLPGEPCMYVRQMDGAIIILYVDDLGVGAADKEAVVKILSELNGKFKCEHVGDFTDSQWLGVRIRRDREKQEALLTQERYIVESLKVFGLVDAPPAKSPLPSDLDDSPIKDGEVITDKPYLKGIGTLMYLSTSTRPDISFATGLLARFCAQPTDRHWELVMRVFQYLKHTKEVGIMIKYDNTAPVLEVHSDADWAGDHDTRKSTSGCVVKAWGSVIAYSSKRQRSISRSTLEAEYIAASSAAQTLQWIVQLFLALDVLVHRVPFYIDNTSAISAITNGNLTERSKHIDISYKIARQLHLEGMIEIRHKRTEFMEADLLTKALTQDRTAYLMDLLGIVGMTDGFGKDGKRLGKSEKGMRGNGVTCG